MPDILIEKLNLNPQEKNALGKGIGRIKSISTFLADAIESLEKSSVAVAVSKAAPWAGIVGSAAADVVPPVKFAIDIFANLTKEHDPEVLGYFACTLAYQRAIEQTVTAMEVPIVSNKEAKELKDAIKSSAATEEVNMKDFSFGNALTHAFVKQADSTLWNYARLAGYSESQSRQLINGVHTRFVVNLKTLLSHGELKERFEPFTQLMELGTNEAQSFEALFEHGDYQRWQFEEDPVFKKEPFALAHIYVETDCGKLTWGEINSRNQKAKVEERVDAFSEKWGGRHDLITAVMDLIGDGDFNDAIVIQGVAGSGKSSFTLRLCSELIKEGLRPIRVRLRDLQLDKHVSERLPEAVLLSEKGRATNLDGYSRFDDLFLKGAIFKEEIIFRGANICPYVLILDGWDEISISATEGFKVRVAKMLDEIRSQYLSLRQTPIRVILTGRPSTAISESNFLRDKTPILTIRPLSPKQLQLFVTRLAKAVEKKPIKLDKDESDRWTFSAEHLDSVLEQYSRDFSKANESSAGNQRMAVLGLPMLAFLAVRLMARQRKEQLPGLAENPTSLYRTLVDMTCEKSGRPMDDPYEIEGSRARVVGADLRQLLRRTAAAMTVFGQEAISYTELTLRLNYQGEELDHRATDATKENVLTSLMISFYFKGGHPQLGCEFLHKSFREYLFAEAIVETLKEYGWKQTRSLPEREPYWQDFNPNAEHDHRYEFSRNLSELLAPQWLSPEVSAHVEQLLVWEINRTREEQPDSAGTSTELLDLEGWARVRDGLADLWDWWAEGVHLRPQPVQDKLRRNIAFAHPYAQDLVELSMPLDMSQLAGLPEPKRLITMDAHLGDGFIRICSLVHYFLAVASGWLEDSHTGKRLLPAVFWEGVKPGPRRCQSIVQREGRSWILFAPVGENTQYFTGHCDRINAGGWRPSGDFPFGANLSGIDLSNAVIQPRNSRDYVVASVWTHANISYADCSGGYFPGHKMNGVLAVRTDFDRAMLENVIFDNSVLTGASFFYSWHYDASFIDVDLSETHGLKLSEGELDEGNDATSDSGGDSDSD